MTAFKKYFPITKQCTYLNTPASGLLPEPVLEYRQEHDLDFFVMGSAIKDNRGPALTAVREKVGTLFSCAPNRVALVPNFSYGFNTLLEGVPTPKKVLLLENDYPSVNWPFESRDFEIVYAHIDGDLEKNIVSAFAKAQPDIFAFSVVQYINGIKIDFDFLKQLKATYTDTLFFADATQYFGTEAFDFDTSAIDVMGGSCYKWMNAGYGNGIFLIKESVAEKVFPKTTGFNSLQGKYKAQEGSFLGRFEPGHQDTLNYGSLGVAIDLINEFGIDTIAQQIQTLSKKAKEAFIERGLLEEAVVQRTAHSSIFNLKGDEALLKRLESQNIVSILRGNGLRVGFHYFNTEDDLQQLLEVL
ncbi:aminotransferase class V-fold PLP-dependent enzyme [uncultured Dokdonia sp.]|uniref:aminotransferase class V-fold PLP-dependent enzyme n=1 Tax=uncultured Dokdonia sp. TaxID=575653 RepID=UPI0026041C1A|nr:aminotransferase class V-fold PLP-dependent enzyme [uncultured Dokdonia sp.]